MGDDPGVGEGCWLGGLGRRLSQQRQPVAVTHQPGAEPHRPAVDRDLARADQPLHGLPAGLGIGRAQDAVKAGGLDLSLNDQGTVVGR